MNLKAAKLAYSNKTKESITSQNLGSSDFQRTANSVLDKGKMYYNSFTQRHEGVVFCIWYNKIVY